GLVGLVLAGDPGVRRITGLVARVRGLARPVAAGKAHQEILLEDELLARVVRRRVEPRVHADGVDRAGLDAVAAEDAAQLVDHERLGEALVAAARVALGVLARLDGDALGRAGRGAAEAGDAAGRAVLAEREPMDAAEAIRVGALLLRVVDGGDALLQRLE